MKNSNIYTIHLHKDTARINHKTHDANSAFFDFEESTCWLRLTQLVHDRHNERRSGQIWIIQKIMQTQYPAKFLRTKKTGTRYGGSAHGPLQWFIIRIIKKHRHDKRAKPFWDNFDLKTRIGDETSITAIVFLRIFALRNFFECKFRTRSKYDCVNEKSRSIKKIIIYQNPDWDLWFSWFEKTIKSPSLCKNSIKFLNPAIILIENPGLHMQAITGCRRKIKL